MRSLFGEDKREERLQKSRISGRAQAGVRPEGLFGTESVLTRRSSNITRCGNSLLGQGTKENYAGGFSASYGEGGAMSEKGESPFEAKCKGALRYEPLKNTPQQTR